jgi:hypothetical protein
VLVRQNSLSVEPASQVRDFYVSEVASDVCIFVPVCPAMRIAGLLFVRMCKDPSCLEGCRRGSLDIVNHPNDVPGIRSREKYLAKTSERSSEINFPFECRFT